MYAKRKYASRRKRNARNYISARRAVRKAKKSNFNRAVKKIIDADTETKQAWYSSGNTLTAFNSGITVAGDMLQIIPAISRGTNTGDRIGQKIKAKSCRVKGHLRITTNEVNDSQTLPQVYVRLMVLSLKFRQSYADATGYTAALSNLLKKGNTTTDWSGVFSDMNAPINSDLFTLHGERKFYLNQSYQNTTGPSPPSTILPIEIKNTIKFFDFNVRCKNKILRYDTAVGSDIYPTNWGPFLCVGYCYLNGGSPDTVSTNLGMEYITDFRFEDN